MPDVTARPNPLTDYPDGWANVSVPAGVTSLRAAKGLPPRPRRVPQRDPSRKRVKCAACWQEGTETRPNDVDGTPILLCPAHAEEWDTDTTFEALGSPESDASLRVAPMAAPRPIVESTPALAPQPNPERQGRRPDETRRQFEAAGYHSRALAHGARRAELPSRSKEARRLEKQRQRARKRLAACAG
jgi:hypothetical protein